MSEITYYDPQGNVVRNEPVDPEPTLADKALSRLRTRGPLAIAVIVSTGIAALGTKPIEQAAPETTVVTNLNQSNEGLE